MTERPSLYDFIEEAADCATCHRMLKRLDLNHEGNCKACAPTVFEKFEESLPRITTAISGFWDTLAKEEP